MNASAPTAVPAGTGPLDREIVSLRAVSKSYGQVLAVNELDLDVKQGEFFALLGPSGCGKTTTLKLISGFEQPDSGEISIHGESVAGLPAFRRDVNTVFQDYALFPHLNIVDNVAYGLRMKGIGKKERRAQASDAIERVHLAGVNDRRIDELSGGQQQRVALARAIVNQPSVLLLDEPLGSLDLKLRRAMQHELRDLQREIGITFLFVTHDQHEALAMADRIAVMNNGVVQQVGAPTEIYEEPRSRFVAEFIGDSGFLTGGIVEVRSGSVGVKLPDGTQISARLPQGIEDESAVPGRDVTCAIRPEHVTIHTETDGAAPHLNQVRGLLKSVEYIGSDSFFVVDAGAAGEVQVRQKGTGPALVVGSEVDLSFDPANTVALTETGEH